MQTNEVRAQEQRLAQLTYAQSPCRAFRIEPHGTEIEAWVEVRPGLDGERFLRHWLTRDALLQLRSVGVSEQGPRVWTLALEFEGGEWVSYTLRAMGLSSWSQALFPLDAPLKAWPEGVVLDPDEADFALEIETDLLGVVLPINGQTVLGFVFYEYSEFALNQLAKRLQDAEYAADYLRDPSPLVGLPRPAFTLEFPAEAPLDRIQIIPPQPGVQLHTFQDSGPRLFKEHWVLRLLRR